MNFETTNLEDTITSGGLFHVEIEGWECVLGFCLNKDEEDKIVYVIINKKVVPKEMFKIIFDTAMSLIGYSKKYGEYEVRFYYDEDFKITKLDEQNTSSCGHSH